MDSSSNSSIEEFHRLCREGAKSFYSKLEESAMRGDVRAMIFISEQAVGKATQRHEVETSDIYFVMDQKEIPFDNTDESDPCNSDSVQSGSDEY